MSEEHEKLYQQLLERCEFHRVRAVRQCKMNHVLSHTLNLTIPLLAAWTTFLTVEDLKFHESVLPISGFILTILTIINSTIKPGEKFANLAKLCIHLHDWKFETELAWKDSDPRTEDQAAKFLKEANLKLTEIGQNFAQLSHPERK